VEWRLRGGTPVTASASVWSMACIAGVLLFALPFVLYLRAIRQLGSAASAQFLALVPAMTAVLAAIFLRERLNALQCFGIATVIAAVTRIGFLQRQK
jgi:drug/metabolite transporter (DMT)-like permease